MRNFVFIALILVFSILVLGYIVLSYFGCVRYMKLYLRPIEKYMELYSNLEKLDNKRVIISIHISQNNITKLKPLIKSLLDQTVRVDGFHINVIGGKEGTYTIPDYLTKIAKVFNVVDKKMGTALIHTISRERNENTRALLVDTNTIYGKDFVETMLSFDKPGSVVYTDEDKDGYVDTSKAYLTCVSCFDVDFLNYDPKTNFNKHFTTYMKKHSIELIKVKYRENYKIL